MKVKDLIEILETYDENQEIVIGMKQNYGTDFATKVTYDIEERKIRSFWGADYKAVVITQGEQLGAVVYNPDEWEDEEEEEEEEEE